jgi:hypothetical protein
MYDLPAFETVPAPTLIYRLVGERDILAHSGIRATLVSPCSDIIRIQDAPCAHRDRLRKLGCTWREDLRSWLVRPTCGNIVWLVRYLQAQGVVMDAGVKLQLERASERLQAREQAGDANTAWLKEDDERRYGVGFDLWEESL